MASANSFSEGFGAMAGNGTANAGSFLAALVDNAQKSPATYIAVTVLLAFTVVANKWSSPQLDSREPPLMRPSIPIIGHLLGMIRHQSHYFKTLEHRKMPIASMPILNDKIYGIWDPVLSYAAFRNRDMSFLPFAVDFAQRELGFSNEVHRKIADGTLLPEFFDGIHVAMKPANVHRMNAKALNYVSKVLDEIASGQVFETTNFYIWVRDLMSIATSEALYGPDNPIKKDPSLLKDMWIFDAGLTGLMMGVAPSITARKCYQARCRLQAALGEYYGANKDQHEEAALVTKNRAAVLRNHDISGYDVGVMEVALLHVSTTNTIPTLFWFVAHVFTRPELVARLRDEVSLIAQHGPNGEVTIDIGDLDPRCPLLVGCYREAIRISNKGMGHRRVMKDTTITDGNGREYLLKKGCNVQMSGDVSHNMERVWGADPDAFVPERFVESKSGDVEAEKLKRAAFIAFGGGKHLCPGRNFAFAENLGFVASLLLGFDVTTLDEKSKPTLETPKQARCSMTAATSTPVNYGEGFGVRVQPRKGWEGMKWRYIS